MANSGSTTAAQIITNVNEYIYEIKEGQIKPYAWDAYTSSWVKNAGNTDPLVRAPHDTILYSYTSNFNTSKIFKTGGVSGTVIATVNMVYDTSGNIISATRA